MEIIILIVGLLCGWVLSVVSYMQAKNYSGSFFKGLQKNIFPRTIAQVVIYVFSSLVFAVVVFQQYSTVWGCLLILCTAVLINAAIVDAYNFEVNIVPLNVAIGVLLGANILALIFNLDLGFAYQHSINIIGGAIAAIIFLLILLITKKKGMGEGDLIIFVVMGLSLGLWDLIVAFYGMVLLGSIYGLLVGIKQKHIKGVKIPFVPFMALGYIIAVLYGQAIIDLYIGTFWII